MRQEVDIRYVVTSLAGSPQHLYENVYCQRGQNLIKLHTAYLVVEQVEAVVGLRLRLTMEFL